MMASDSQRAAVVGLERRQQILRVELQIIRRDLLALRRWWNR